jgi:tripartite-type tricarboxylate transporter receptor subunit TctC
LNSFRSAMRKFVFPLLAAMLAFTSGLAQSQAFPTRPVTIVVPYAAGGGTDVVTRQLARALEKHWGQPVVVENLAGADGTIGTQRVLRAPADGYTLLLQLNTMLLWKPGDNSSKIDLVGELKFISLIQTAPLAFAVSSKFPGNTMADYVAYCKVQQCSWGTATKYAQLIGKTLMDVTGLTKSVNVNYKGGGPMLNDLLGGHVTMVLPSVASGQRFVQQGQMKFLAVGSVERFPLVPTVPTLVEQGFKVFGDSWYGLMVAKDTPPQAFNAIVEGIKAVAKDKGLVDSIESNGGTPVFSTPEQFNEYARKERQYLAPLMAKYPLTE